LADSPPGAIGPLYADPARNAALECKQHWLGNWGLGTVGQSNAPSDIFAHTRRGASANVITLPAGARGKARSIGYGGRKASVFGLQRARPVTRPANGRQRPFILSGSRIRLGKPNPPLRGRGSFLFHVEHWARCASPPSCAARVPDLHRAWRSSGSAHRIGCWVDYAMRRVVHSAQAFKSVYKSKARW